MVRHPEIGRRGAPRRDARADAALDSTLEVHVSAEILRFLYDFDHAAITRNCGGLTHAESIAAPAAGNSANFVLGHIIQNRMSVLKLLGETHPWSDEDGAMYARGVKEFDPSRARDFDDMLKDLDVTQERIRTGLARLDAGALGEKLKPDDKWTLAETLHFMSFHESYHAGQLGLLRRLAGKPGAI